MISNFKESFDLALLILQKGGWVLLLIALFYMFKILYMDYINIRWYHSLDNDWVFLKITVPLENEKSPLAFEHIFNQLHSIHGTRTLAETYLEGRFQIWFVWEVTSIGGVIGNYVRILQKHRDTLEAAIYSQYPEAEITEAEDYMTHIPPYQPESANFDIFAFNLILKKPDAYPIRSYLDFEHSSAETFVDPISGMWEELGKLSPYEMFIAQYIFEPVDDKWKEAGYQLVKFLKGEKGATDPTAAGGFFMKLAATIGKPFNFLIDALTGPSPQATRPSPKDELPPSMMLHLSEGEKEIISAIERQLAKLGYKTKIRCLYLAPKEKYNPSPVYTAVIGAYKSLGSTNLNSLKPDTDRWTKVRYWIFKNAEKPILDLRLNFRKRKYMSMIRRRFFPHGAKPFVLNSEEIATILHFPSTEVRVPQIERVPVTKVQPPPELPVVYE